MTRLRLQGVFLSAGIGLGFNAICAAGSEPSIYSKMLTPSPLGKDRVLVVCVGDDVRDKNLVNFYDEVSWDEFSERQLTIVEISQNSVQSVLPSKSGNVKEDMTRARHHDYEDALRLRAECENDFKFALIGKDTGVKKRWKNTLPQDELFQVIDAMPMRQFEMRKGKRND